MKIAHVRTWLADIPLPRLQKRAFGDFDKVNHLIVQIDLEEGLQGVGEAATCGGPTWSEDCVEAAKIVTDRYLTPLLLGQDPRRITYLMGRLDKAVKGNRFAKAALEMALFDLAGQALQVPVYDLLGGLVQDRFPVAWLINLNDLGAAGDEIQAWLDKGFQLFKVKMGEAEPAHELQVVQAIAREFGSRIRLRVDVNGGWNEATAARMIPRLAEMGIELVEQPLPRWDVQGLARLSRLSVLPLMADESLYTPEEAFELARQEAVRAFCFKLAKSGGILSSQKIAAVAQSAGISGALSSMLETSLGAAAALHFGAATPGIDLGSDLVGPLFLTDDLAAEPVQYEQGCILVPRGPGLGVKLDGEKLRRYARVTD